MKTVDVGWLLVWDESKKCYLAYDYSWELIALYNKRLWENAMESVG